ncbi:MAG: hypothetical protein ACWA5A_17245 [Marinibacterium sp.]
MSLRVVNLGLPKSGTTTLARALRRAGLRIADYRIQTRQTNDTNLHGKFVGALLYEGYFDGGDPAARLADFDGLTEISLLRRERSLWPQTDFGLIDALRRHHPDLRFVASRRDAFEMSQSMLAWSNLGTDRLPAADVPGLPAGFGETTKARMQWIDGHYTALQRWFQGDPAFLEYDVADPDAPGRIGAHLGLDLPWWGRTNVSALRRKMARG